MLFAMLLAGLAPWAVTPMWAVTLMWAVPAAGQQAVADGTAGLDAPDRALVVSIQELLAAVGFPPGPADGIAGARTRAAIARFQQQSGMVADGEPSEAVRRALVEELRDAGTKPVPAPVPAEPAAPAAASTGPRPPQAPAAMAETPPSSAPGAEAGSGSVPRDATDAPPVDDLVGTTWRFRDGNGARFTLSFAAAGAIADRADTGAWSWSRTGDVIRIRYTNGWGTTVARTGRIEGDRMSGRGTSTSGASWEWTAEKRARPDVNSPFRAPAG